MPATKRTKRLYERGGYKLVRREGRPALEIIWYDHDRKRERSASAGTSDLDAGRAALDRLYLERTGGDCFCPTCGQRQRQKAVFVTSAIADYLTLTAGRSSIEAIRARLTHVLGYLVHADQATVTCEMVDEDWIERLRAWLRAQPVVSTGGATRERSLSTVENSVLQLAAAINKSGGVSARFKPRQPKEVNRTPQHRADIAELAAMFRHCVAPAPGKQPVARLVRERAGLLAFLRVSVATMARPDAAHDFSTAPARRQWNGARRVLNLNPDGRRQTRKYRAVVPVGARMAAVLDATNGLLVPQQSVKSAWESMAAALGLPGAGESGMKLVRRSMADIVRSRLPQEAWGELEMFLGHDRFDDVSDLYAPFRPDYLRRALAAIDQVIEEIEAAVPGAFAAPSLAAGAAS